MNTILRLICVAAFAGLTSLNAGIFLENYLPEDTLFVFKVENLPALNEAYDGSPLAEFFASDEISQFFSPIIQQFGLDIIGSKIESGDAGIGWEEFYELFSGELVMAGVAPRIEEDGEDALPRFFLMTEYNGSKEVLGTLMSYISDEAHPPRNATVVAFDEEFLGVTLHIEEVEFDTGEVRKNGWAYAEGVVVIGDPVDALRNAVARIVSPGNEPTLADKETFINSRESAVGAYVSIYVDLKFMIKTLNQGFLSMLYPYGIHGNQSIFGITPEEVLEGLGLEVLESFALSWGDVQGYPGMKAGLYFQ